MIEAKRQSKYELLRCILMTMVITVHYLNPEIGGGMKYVAPYSLNYYIVIFIESICVIGVNIFVLISGYLGLNKQNYSLRKPIGLLLYVIAYKILFYIMTVAVGYYKFSMLDFLKCFIPSNWYIVLYVALMAVAPFINYLIHNISKKQVSVLVVLMIFIFSIWDTVFDLLKDITGIDIVGISTIGMNGSQQGYNIINFIMMYLVGCYLRISDNDKNESNRKVKHIVLWMTSVSCVFVGSLISRQFWNYNNIFVVLSSVLFFIIYNEIVTLPYSKLINIVAKSVLGIFLIQNKGPIRNTLWGMFNIKMYAVGWIFGMLLNMALCVLVTFIVCFLIDFICRYFTRPIRNVLDKINVLNKEIVCLVQMNAGK